MAAKTEEKLMRRTVRSTWRCKKCGEEFGGENIARYCVTLPGTTPPTWFFASMALLDHLRDCRDEEHAGALRAVYGDDFLNHPKIHEWFNVHATVSTRLILEEDV